jgi:hypothetical protein
MSSAGVRRRRKAEPNKTKVEALTTREATPLEPTGKTRPRNALELKLKELPDANEKVCM